MATQSTCNNRHVKIIFALSLVSIALSILIIHLSSSTIFHISSLDANFLKSFTITLAFVTILCHVVVFLVELEGYRRSQLTQSVDVAYSYQEQGHLPRVQAWFFFLLAAAWASQFCLLIVVSGDARRLGIQSPWNIPGELYLTTFEVLILAVIGGVNRVRFLGRKIACKDERNMSEDTEMPIVEVAKAPPPIYYP